MARQLTSLHGKLLGLDKDARLIAPKGLVSGNHGSQFAHHSPTAVEMFDDFVGDTLSADYWLATEGTDSATSDAAILAGGVGGVLRLTTGDAGTGLAADTEQLNGPLQWKASNGGLVFQTRLKLSAITTCWAFLGFTDVATGLEAPIISAGSADTITTTASDAVGFMFDTRQSTDNWWLVGVAADVDATAQNSGFAPVADTYATFRIELSATGVATFFYNGNQVGTAMSGAVTAGTALCPIIAVSKTSVAASMTMDIDYIDISMTR